MIQYKNMKINPEFKKIAFLAVNKAGKIIEKNFRKTNKISFKKDSSLITKIDLEAEKAIIKLIKKNFPSHDILSEENGGKIGEEYTWIIDPLDGTTNYLSKFPFFSVSIALLYKKEPILSVNFNPVTKELYFVEKRKGAFLNGKKIKVSKTQVLEKTILLFGKGRKKEEFLKFFQALKKAGRKCRTFRFWGAANLSLCYLASGRVDGFIFTGDKIWDSIAGVLLVKEAGGKITDFQGKDWQIDSKTLIATNGKIHNQLLKLLR